MLRKTISFVDCEGNPRKEDFYFNLNKAELMKMELGVVGGMRQKLDRIIKAQDNVEILKAFEEIIAVSYGEKSDDGKHFKKSPAITANFIDTDAYSELFMELITDADKFSAFINGIIPQALAEEVAAQQKLNAQAKANLTLVEDTTTT